MTQNLLKFNKLKANHFSCLPDNIVIDGCVTFSMTDESKIKVWSELRGTVFVVAIVSLWVRLQAGGRYSGGPT